ncbi:MAG: hypothetical protein FWB71_04620, partial [Defluviitaleaceae bacterium]|nr:hypothetical protein [Defluviitaleaceae bacterium]
MQLDELKKIIEGAGIVGAGGGGFPTHLKLDARADVVILNCAECEPLLGVDKFLLANFAGEILAGLDKVARVLGARGIVAVKESYGAAISAVEAQLENFYNISIHLLGDFYPAGDEIQLVYEAAGVIVPPGGLPIEAGCIVLNTETVYNIYHALDSGAAVTKKWLTVAG